MISLETYEALRAEYGERASWAVWTMPGDRPKSNTGDLSLFSSPSICDILHNDYVLVALNRAVHGDGSQGACRTWGNFHSEDNRRQNDYKLRHALSDTPLWGAYITDILEMEETDSSCVMKRVKNEPEWVSENVLRLRHELSLLGGDPVLVAVGNDAHWLLQEHLGKDFNIVKIPHYASRAANNKDVYKQIVIDAIP